MRRILLSASILATAPVAALPAQAAQRSDTGRVVETVGQGVVWLTPDYAVITIEVSARDSSPAIAAQRSSVQLRRVLDSLNARKQAAETVTVAALSVRPTEDRARAVIVGYEAAAEVRVAIRQLDRIGPILDVALRAGATGLRDVHYRSDRETAARREALGIAFANATSDARALARAAAVDLGPLLRISTTSNCSFVSLAEESGWATVSVAPRDIRVIACAEATYRLGPSVR